MWNLFMGAVGWSTWPLLPLPSSIFSIGFLLPALSRQASSSPSLAASCLIKVSLSVGLRLSGSSDNKAAREKLAAAPGDAPADPSERGASATSSKRKKVAVCLPAIEAARR